jgi:heparin/heparan-sulfate lyase
MGFGNVYHSSQRFVPYHWIYMRRPDGRMMTQGDDFVWTPKLPLIYTSSYYQDGYILADYLKDEWDFSVLKHATHPLDQLFVLLWHDPDLEPWDLNELPTTRYFGFPFGWMVARTGWGKDAVIANMQINIYNFLNHQHHDAGAFQIWYRGVLAADTGLYSGTGGGYVGAHNVNYYKRTIAHNSLLIYDPEEAFVTRGFREIEKVNDGGQRFPNGWTSARGLEDFLEKDYRTGEVLGWWFGPDSTGPEISYLKGDITEAYSRKVSLVRRSFVFLNLGDAVVPAALVVFDRIVSANPSYRKYWLLHSMEEPRVDGSVIDVTLTQKGWSGRLVTTALLPPAGNLEVEKVGGPGKKHWVFGKSFESNPRPRPRDNTVYEDADWRVQLSPVAQSREDLFLNAMLVMDRENDQLPTVTSIDQGERVGVLVADRAVLFDRTAEQTDRPVVFTLSESRTWRIFVVDLAEGIWQIRRNGKIHRSSLPVTQGAGVLFFEGPAGDYELLK